MDLEFTAPLEPTTLLETLQPLLPDGIALRSANDVPVSGRSLSQEISGAVWSFDLAPCDGGSADWKGAVTALLSSETLLWHDTDKKGRPRQRDCRPSLRNLVCVDNLTGSGVRLRLEAEVDEMGRSVRPGQIQHWLSEQLSQPLALENVSRDALVLARC